MARKPARTSRWVELVVLASVAFVAVLVAAWIKMPEVHRGVGTVVDDLAERFGFEP